MLAILALAGCSEKAEQPKTAEVKRVAPADESRHFPQDGLVKTDLVPDHLLGKEFMPGGNLASYRRGKLEFQEFVARMADSQAAAFSLLDWKKALADNQYLAHMGGYYGTDGGRPVYVFAKKDWVAGIVGLPQEKADPLARELAAHL